MTKKQPLGRTCVEKDQFWIDFGVPGRSLGKALGRILGGNFGNKKKRKKGQQAGRVREASEGYAMAGKEGLGWMGQALSSTPSLIPRDGRADCLRSASPAEATWRL